MLFEKGNKAAAVKRSKKAVAQIIRKKLEDEKDSLSAAQFTTLVSKYNTLVTKRTRRYHKHKRRFPWLSKEEQETMLIVLQIEAERETGRLEGKSQEPNGIAS
jgi:poly-beta-hydroxyalkanoate depolymerase